MLARVGDALQLQLIVLKHLERVRVQCAHVERRLSCFVSLMFMPSLYKKVGF